MSDPNPPCCGGDSCCNEPSQTTQVTSENTLNRRSFLQRAAMMAGGVGVLTGANSAFAGENALSRDEVASLDAVRRKAYGKKDGRRSKYPMQIDREYNSAYAGANLNHVAFPIGGIGAGMYCLEGTGAISHMSVRNHMEFFHEPSAYAAICVKGETNVARVLEGPIPDWKFFGGAGNARGGEGRTYGFPRFQEAAFLARFPFANIELRDDALPLDVTLTGWSPFIPGNADDSSLPVGTLEYTFTNTSASYVDAVFSFNSNNFMKPGSGAHYRGSDDYGISEFPNGFLLWGDENPATAGSFSISVDSDDVVVDHCWFRGGWWDPLTLAWRNVEEANMVSNPPQEGGAPGASLFVPIQLAPGASRTIRVLTAWYAGNTNLRVGSPIRSAFGYGTARGTTKGQQDVAGYLGQRLVNTFHPYGDGSVGNLTSSKFNINHKYIHFLIGGGSAENGVAMELHIGDKVVDTASGRNAESLQWHTWDVKEFKKETATIRIVDNSSSGWGHINVDHIVFSNQSLEQLKEPNSTGLKMSRGTILYEDFESMHFNC